MIPAIHVRSFDSPDYKLDMKDAGCISIIEMPDGIAGMHAIFEPGWTHGLLHWRNSSGAHGRFRHGDAHHQRRLL